MQEKELYTKHKYVYNHEALRHRLGEKYSLWI